MEDVTVFHRLRHPQTKPKYCPTTFSQLLAAEFCASLSRRMAMMAGDLVHGATTGTENNESQRMTSTPPVPSFQLEVLQDLSAHYGSAALRRGKSKILGVPGRSVQAAYRGHHRSHNRVWQVKRAHKLFCHHCGIWLDHYTRQTLEISDLDPAEDKSVSSSQGKVSSLVPRSDQSCPTITRWTCCKRCLHRLFRKGTINASGVFKGERGGAEKASVTENKLVDLATLQSCRIKRHRRKRKTVAKKTTATSPTEVLSIEKARQATLQRVIPKGPLIHRGQKKKQQPPTKGPAHPTPPVSTTTTTLKSPLRNANDTSTVKKETEEAIAGSPKSSLGSHSMKSASEMGTTGGFALPTVGVPKPKGVKKAPAPHTKGKYNPTTSATNDLLKNLGL